MRHMHRVFSVYACMYAFSRILFCSTGILLFHYSAYSSIPNIVDSNFKIVYASMLYTYTELDYYN